MSKENKGKYQIVTKPSFYVTKLQTNIKFSPWQNEIVGRPNLQKVPETLLPGARLRAFSKLFLDLASFF